MEPLETQRGTVVHPTGCAFGPRKADEDMASTAPGTQLFRSAAHLPFRSTNYPIQVPAVGNALELVLAGVLEGETRTRDQIPDGL